MCDRKDSNYKHFVCYQKQTILFRMFLSAFDIEKTSKLAINVPHFTPYSLCVNVSQMPHSKNKFAPLIIHNGIHGLLNFTFLF